MSRGRIAAAIVLLLLTAATVAFIFSNSAELPEVSNAKSDKVIEIIEEKLPELKEAAVNAAGGGEAAFSKLVRKSAHFFEFFILGCELAGLSLLVFSRPFGRLSEPAFFALLIAVTDEYIQGFFGRTDSVDDVILDFVGSLFGILLVLLITLTVRFFAVKAKNAGNKTY